MRTTLKRLQRLEQRQVEQDTLMDTSGARERLLARLAQMGERQRSDPNWRPPTDADAAAINHRLKAFFAAKASDA